MSSFDSSRRSFIKQMGAGVALTGLAPLTSVNAPMKAEKPNIVIIFADDLDFDELNPYDITRFPCRTGAHQLGFTEWREPWRYYHDPHMLTPHLDQMATQGTQFNRFYVTSAICTPSRYSLFTGRYASKSKPFVRKNPPGTQALIQWDTTLGSHEPHLARLLKGAGYRTGFVGKWHLGDPIGKPENLPDDADPDDPQIAKRIDEHYQRAVQYLTREIGFDVADRVYLKNKEGLGLPKELRHHNLEWIIEGAVDFINQSATFNAPFFLYAPLTVPHSQFEAIYGEFKGSNPLATPAGLLETIPDVQPPRSSLYERLGKYDIDPRNAVATWIDDGVGAILKTLKDKGLEENTIVIFLSDHQSRGKYTCYEGARVPCLMRWPNHIPGGTTIDRICANIDIVPSLLEAAGVEFPDNRKIDGSSFLHLFRTPASNQWRQSLLLECGNTRAVVSEQWKYIANRPSTAVIERMEAERKQYTRTGKKRRIGWDGRSNPHQWGEEGIRYVADVDFPHYFDFDQLYHMRSDPFEQVNLFGHPSYVEVVSHMRQELSRHLETLPHSFAEFYT